MKVKTSYPVRIVSSKPRRHECGTSMSSATGTKPKKTAEQKAATKQKVWNAAKGIWTNANEMGIVDKGLSMFGLGKGNQQTYESPAPVAEVPYTPAPVEKSGMSKTTKIVIAVAAVAVVGAIIYAVTRSGKPSPSVA